MPTDFMTKDLLSRPQSTMSLKCGRKYICQVGSQYSEKTSSTRKGELFFQTRKAENIFHQLTGSKRNIKDDFGQKEMI